MENIKKGQKIWIWVDRRFGSRIIETTVKTIGPKYITTSYGIKYYANTLREVNACGAASYIILDLEEHKKEEEYKRKIKALGKIEWNCIESEDIDKIFNILRDYI